MTFECNGDGSRETVASTPGAVLEGFVRRLAGERSVRPIEIEENRVLRRQLGARRLRLTDDDRRRLAFHPCHC